jgi:hypothetical protein
MIAVGSLASASPAFFFEFRRRGCRIRFPKFQAGFYEMKQFRVSRRPPWYFLILTRFINLMMFITEPRFVYLVVYVLFTWLGRYISPFFYAFHLLDIVTQFETLKAVIRSVTRNGTQLLLTVALVLVIVYYYAIIAFSYLRNNVQYGVRACCFM